MESEVLRENKLKCQFFHHKLHTDWSKIEPGPAYGKAGTWTAEYLFNAHIHVTVTSPLIDVRLWL